MILSGGRVVNGDFNLKSLDIEIKDGKISDMKAGIVGDDVRDVSGCYVLPGFIDTHIHGAYGTRISDQEPDLEAMCQFEATQGVTGLAITTAASAFPDLLRQLKCAAEVAENGVEKGTKILGIHGEGPFISKNRKGAMNGDNIIAPDIEKLNEMIKTSKGLLKIMTVAPENEGASELIRYAVRQGITVSLGHTVANYDETLAGIEAGATQLTHTFNAMVGLNHREPGVLGAGLTNSDIVCEMICDYVHLHPAIVQMIYKLKGADKVNIISDSGHAAGMNVTEFTVDGLTRYVKDGVVRLADGTIAGSAKTMLNGVRNLLKSGIPIEEVSKMASLNPAKSLKMDDVTGSLAPGKAADIVVLDNEYNVVCTYIDGVCVYDANDSNKQDKSIILGVDIGGTNIKFGVIDGDYNIIEALKIPTIKDNGAEAMIQDIIEVIQNLRKTYPIEKIGIGTPGTVDYKKGICIRSSNLPYSNTPLVAMVEEATKLPVYLANDATCAVFGERYAGNGQNYADLIMLTLGTGVGGGIITNGTPYGGSRGGAGEFGHIIIEKNGRQCNCGQQGCLEKYASITALIEQTKVAADTHPESILAEMSSHGITGQTAFDAQKAGCPIANQVLETYFEYIATGITSLVRVFQPEAVVLGGAITNEDDALLLPIKEKITLPVELLISPLKNDAGVIGAAAMAINEAK